jgi:putative SOS response-associated peptidase YedK
MCNDYERHISWVQYRDAMQAAGLGIPLGQGGKDLPPADDVRINDIAPVMRAAGNVVEHAPMRFGFPPSGRGGPVFNFKSEGRRFDNSNRCLIPASAFFELTGKKYPSIASRCAARRSSPSPASGGKERDPPPSPC